MSKFHVKLSARAKKAGSKNVAMFDAMYADREKLETIFRFFDTDGNGSISREEFHRVRKAVTLETRIQNTAPSHHFATVSGSAFICTHLLEMRRHNFAPFIPLP